MILPSTHARLVAQGASVFRLEILPFCILGINNPAQVEHFTTRAAANRRAEPYIGLTEVSIEEKPAESYSPLEQL